MSVVELLTVAASIGVGAMGVLSLIFSLAALARPARSITGRMLGMCTVIGYCAMTAVARFAIPELEVALAAVVNLMLFVGLGCGAFGALASYGQRRT